jgi:hypothetical protein
MSDAKPWKRNIALFLTSQIISLFGSTLVQCMLGSLVMPVGLVVLGPLADVIGLGELFIITGGIQILFSFIFLLNKTVSEAGNTELRAS